MSKIKSISIKGFKSIKNLEDFKLSQKNQCINRSKWFREKQLH